jgi:hypothetical protein
MLMTMSYNYDIQAKFYDRWVELEQAQLAKPAQLNLPNFIPIKILQIA